MINKLRLKEKTQKKGKDYWLRVDTNMQKWFSLFTNLNNLKN